MARGSLKKRYKSSWSIVIDLGHKADPKTGKKRRRQKWFSCKGTKREAEVRLAELLHQYNSGSLILPSADSFGSWLDHWLKMVTSRTTYNTGKTYRAAISNHLKPALGDLALQDVRAAHLEAYYLQKCKTLSPKTLALHHCIISGALASAQRKDLIRRNEAKLVDNRPTPEPTSRDPQQHCWTTDEARQFLEAASTFGPQSAALFCLALDTGMRKGELLGLNWKSVDLTAGKVTVSTQLIKAGPSRYPGRHSRSSKRTASTRPHSG